jgi:hypothetical protein
VGEIRVTHTYTPQCFAHAQCKGKVSLSELLVRVPCDLGQSGHLVRGDGGQGQWGRQGQRGWPRPCGHHGRREQHGGPADGRLSTLPLVHQLQQGGVEGGREGGRGSASETQGAGASMRPRHKAQGTLQCAMHGSATHKGCRRSAAHLNNGSKSGPIALLLVHWQTDDALCRQPKHRVHWGVIQSARPAPTHNNRHIHLDASWPHAPASGTGRHVRGT